MIVLKKKKKCFHRFRENVLIQPTDNDEQKY